MSEGRVTWNCSCGEYMEEYSDLRTAEATAIVHLELVGLASGFIAIGEKKRVEVK
jgi:hypothetical protein